VRTHFIRFGLNAAVLLNVIRMVTPLVQPCGQVRLDGVDFKICGITLII
jgi:hypothetical protein